MSAADDMLKLGATPAQPAAPNPNHPMAALGGIPAGPSAPREEPGSAEALLRGAAQGASMGFADEVTGAGEAAGDVLLDPNTSLSDFMNKYRQHRDESRANYKAAAEAHPYLTGAGNLAGGVGMGIATGGLGAGAAGAAKVGLGTALKKAAVTGAGIGAAAGLGDSEADITKGNIGGAAADTATGAGVGAVAGPAMYGLINGTARAAKGLGNILKTRGVDEILNNYAIGADRGLPTYGSDALEHAKNAQKTIGDTIENGLQPRLNELRGERTAATQAVTNTQNVAPWMNSLRRDIAARKMLSGDSKVHDQADLLNRMLDNFQKGPQFDVVDDGPSPMLQKIQDRLKKLNAQSSIDQANRPAERLSYNTLAANPEAGINEGEYVMNNLTGKPQKIGFKPSPEGALQAGENGEMVQKSGLADKIAAVAKEQGLDPDGIFEANSIHGSPLEQKTKLINALEDHLNADAPNEKTFSLTTGHDESGEPLIYVKNNVTNQRVGVPLRSEDIQPSQVKRSVRLGELSPDQIANYQKSGQIPFEAQQIVAPNGDANPAQMQIIKDELKNLSGVGDNSLNDKSLKNLLSHYIYGNNIQPVYGGDKTGPALQGLKQAQELLVPKMTAQNAEMSGLLKAKDIGARAQDVINAEGQGKSAIRAGAATDQFIDQIGQVNPGLAKSMHENLGQNAKYIDAYAAANQKGLHQGGPLGAPLAMINRSANAIGQMVNGSGEIGDTLGRVGGALKNSVNKGFDAIGNSAMGANTVGSPLVRPTIQPYLAAAGDAIKKGMNGGNDVEYSNNNSYAKDPNSLRLMAQKAAMLPGGATLNKMLTAIAEKDDIGRNASMFALQQNPAYREMLQKLNQSGQ